jgi:uncharacterized protein YndB with AHSA1/START domain
MTVSTDSATDVPVRHSITVMATPEHAFRVFTEGIDTWWPREHHIGKGTLEKTVIEPRLNGRCYGRTTDGVETLWGTVLAWEPPHRFVFAWQITPEWQCEPDLAKASEVEIRFTPEGKGTRVDLEHRYFHRHGAGGAAMRTAVDAPNGWTGLLSLFAARIESTGQQTTN